MSRPNETEWLTRVIDRVKLQDKVEALTSQNRMLISQNKNLKISLTVAVTLVCVALALLVYSFHDASPTVNWTATDANAYLDATLPYVVNATNVFEILPKVAAVNLPATMAACVEILFTNEHLMKSSEWLQFKKSTSKEVVFDLFAAYGARYRKERNQ